MKAFARIGPGCVLFALPVVAGKPAGTQMTSRHDTGSLEFLCRIVHSA